MSYIGPSEGTHLPPFDGTDLTGRAMTVDYARENRDSLLFVFSPYCGYTNDNWNNWDRVLRQLRPGTSVRFIDVSNQMTHEYAVRHGLQATQVVTNISAETRLRHNLIITPMTVLLGPHGAVRKVWVGALSEQSVASILEGMHVH